MEYPWLDAFLCSMPGAAKDYKAEWGWHRYQVDGKLFAALCAPGPQYKIYGGHPLLTLKCDPPYGETLRETFADILPGFYMDKRNWISVCLNGSVPEEVLRTLCDHSYARVFGGLTKKRQREILETANG